jgi:hypothetical protein
LRDTCQNVNTKQRTKCSQDVRRQHSGRDRHFRQSVLISTNDIYGANASANDNNATDVSAAVGNNLVVFVATVIRQQNVSNDSLSKLTKVFFH